MYKIVFLLLFLIACSSTNDPADELPGSNFYKLYAYQQIMSYMDLSDSARQQLQDSLAASLQYDTLVFRQEKQMFFTRVLEKPELLDSLKRHIKHYRQFKNHTLKD
jgi:hypothetical protein